jgi:type III pantothenate kinase
VILLIDAGNTRIKWRIVAGGALCAAGVSPTADAAGLNAAWRPFALTRAVLSCVADAALQADLIDRLTARGVSVQRLVAERERYGVINRYEFPEKLGADRYAALIAAARLQLDDCVVASIGTATTLDWLDRNREFRGGVILPGPDLMRGALLGGTRQIESRMQDDVDPGNFAAAGFFPPRTTNSAVSGGIHLAQVGAIQAFCAAVQAETGTRPQLLLTGGARARLLPGLHMELIEIEDLVLEGLAWIARETACAN